MNEEQGRQNTERHAANVAAELLRYYPPSTDGAENRIETEAAFVIQQLLLGRPVEEPGPQSDERYGKARAALIRLHQAVTDCEAVRLALYHKSGELTPMDENELKAAIKIAAETIEDLRAVPLPAPREPTQAWLPDTFIERAYHYATHQREPLDEMDVPLTVMEASAIRNRAARVPLPAGDPNIHEVQCPYGRAILLRRAVPPGTRCTCGEPLPGDPTALGDAILARKGEPPAGSPKEGT